MTTPAADEPRALYLHGTVPIPVGHRVEVVLHGNLANTPLVTDLDTGITFGSMDHFKTWESKGSADLHSPPTRVLPELRERSRWTGRVVVCQVLQNDSENVQTTLVIAPDPPSATPYR